MVSTKYADRIPPEAMSQTLVRAIERPGLIESDDTALIIYDLSLLKARLQELKAAFPSETRHAVAVKANPLVGILRLISAQGLGLEVASLPELYLADTLGLPPEQIVFDSPAKTRAELRYALERGVYVNANSLAELARIATILGERPSASAIGVRLNPQVGTGTIRATSVATEHSKFGVPLDANHEDLCRRFLDFPWLKGVHLHIGSQGCPVEMLIEGLTRVVDFVNEANSYLHAHGTERYIEIIDIGGGLPVPYRTGDERIPLATYATQVIDVIKRCSSPQLTLITEFGRYLHANAGWAASRVEDVLRQGDVDIAVIHLGADMFLRKSYRPEEWHHDITVLKHDGTRKQEDEQRKTIIAGPLCFAGDVIADGILLPPIEPGDFVVIHDAGAYTHSMWSRYNSRQFPKVIGYQNNGESFDIIKKRETLHDLWNLWS